MIKGNTFSLTTCISAMYMKMLLKQAYVPQVEGVDKIQARKSQVACVKLAG